jgi:hypothetical protein
MNLSFVTRPGVQKAFAMEVGKQRSDRIDCLICACSLVSRKQLLPKHGDDATLPAMISPPTDMENERLSLLGASFIDTAAIIGSFSSCNTCNEMQW